MVVGEGVNFSAPSPTTQSKGKTTMSETVMTSDPYEMAYILLKADAEVVDGQPIGVGWDRLVFTIVGHGVAQAQKDFRLELTNHAIFASQYKEAILRSFRTLKDYKTKANQKIEVETL